MKIAIIGRTEILYDTAIYLKEAGHDICCIITAKEAPEYTRTVEDFRRMAKLFNIPFASGPKIIKDIDLLRDSDAEIGVSINYTGLIPQSVIDIFPLGLLNSHGGDLPRYRGNACQAWAILNAEKQIGLCIHKMIGDELDSGDIIERDYLKIDHNSKITQVLEWTHKRIPALMLSAVNKLSNDSSYFLEKQSRELKDALRCYPRTPDDGRIDWDKPAVDILRLINASNKPYSGAYCEFESEKLIIWDAVLIEDGENFLAVPGQVTSIMKGSIIVACGVGKLGLCSVEFDGKVLTPDTFIKSIRKRLL